MVVDLRAPGSHIPQQRTELKHKARARGWVRGFGGLSCVPGIMAPFFCFMCSHMGGLMRSGKSLVFLRAEHCVHTHSCNYIQASGFLLVMAYDPRQCDRRPGCAGNGHSAPVHDEASRAESAVLPFPKGPDTQLQRIYPKPY